MRLSIDDGTFDSVLSFFGSKVEAIVEIHKSSGPLGLFERAT